MTKIKTFQNTKNILKKITENYFTYKYTGRGREHGRELKETITNLENHMKTNNICMTKLNFKRKAIPKNKNI